MLLRSMLLGAAVTALLANNTARAQHRGGGYYGGYRGYSYGGLGYGYGLGGYGFGINAPGYGYNVGGYGSIPYRVSAPPYPYRYGMNRGYYRSVPTAPAMPGYPAVAEASRPPSGPGPAETVTVAKEPAPASVTVIVPEGAQVWFNGEDTGKTGGSQVFTSEPIDPGKTVNLSIKTRWDGRSLEMQLPTRAGDKMTVDLRDQ